MVDQIRVGVVGVQYGARVHIPALQSEDAFTVTALCSRRIGRVRDAAERFGVAEVFTDFHEMARSNNVDMMAVVGPPHLHHPMAMAALEAGKHVLCEKPFTATLRQAQELRDEAHRQGVTAMLGHEFRYSSGRAYVKELIDDGYLGNLYLARGWLFNGSRVGREGSQYNPESDDAGLGGGMLWSQGSHYIDSLMCWFGDVDSVWGRVFTHAPARTREDGTMVLIDADDAFEATLTFATGGVAHVSMSYLAAFGKGGGFELYGDAGTLVTPQTSNTPNPPAHGVVLGARVGDVDGLQEMPVPTHLEPIEDDRDMRLAPTRLLLRDFARGVEDGESPSPNFEDGYQLQRVLQGIRDASLSGQTMNLSKE